MKARGHGGGGVEGDTKCELCGEPGEGSTWHVLSNCKHPSITAKRVVAAETVRAKVEEVTAEDVGNANAARKVMMDSLVMMGDNWCTPKGWEGEGAKAGTAPNPWYGIFPSEWLDIWCGEEEGEAKVVDQVTNRLRKLRDEAVEGCWEVWKAAAEVWGTLAKEESERVRCEEALKRSEVRRAAREAALLRRAKELERSRRSFLHARSLKRAMAGAKEEVQSLIRRGGMTSGREDQLLRWSEWPAERLLRWWRNLCSKRVNAKKKVERDGRSRWKVEPIRGQPSIWDVWGRGRTGGTGVKLPKQRGVGDGADDPG